MLLLILKNHKYSPAAGLESLRKVIVETSKQYSGFDVKPNNVIVSNGGKQSILTAFLSILDDGDEVLIPAPYWTTYPEAVKIAGGNPVFIDTEKDNNFKVTVDLLENAKNSNTKMLVWCSPSNPTGVVYTKEEAEEIVRELSIESTLRDSDYNITYVDEIKPPMQSTALNKVFAPMTDRIYSDDEHGNSL